MDEEVASADIPKQWQEARANRRMQFKVGNYRDGSWESNIRLLTGTIKVDWIQLPVEQYLAALPTLKQGAIARVFRQKGAAPWGITNAEKLQLSVFLPNELSLENWYCQGPNMSHKNTKVFQAQKQHRPCASNTALVSILPCLQRPRRRCCMKS